MSDKLDVMFSSDSSEWETPDELFRILDNEFGFTMDVCATEKNAKVRNYISPQQDWGSSMDSVSIKGYGNIELCKCSSAQDADQRNRKRNSTKETAGRGVGDLAVKSAKRKRSGSKADTTNGEIESSGQKPQHAQNAENASQQQQNISRLIRQRSTDLPLSADNATGKELGSDNEEEGEIRSREKNYSLKKKDTENQGREDYQKENNQESTTTKEGNDIYRPISLGLKETGENASGTLITSAHTAEVARISRRTTLSHSQIQRAQEQSGTTSSPLASRATQVRGAQTHTNGLVTTLKSTESLNICRVCGKPKIKVDSCWLNPPYGRAIGKWMQKAYSEAYKGNCTVVCLVPARTDTYWWWNYARTGEVRFIKGRLKFKGAENGAPFPSAVVIFRKGHRPWMAHTIYWTPGQL